MLATYIHLLPYKIAFIVESHNDRYVRNELIYSRETDDGERCWSASLGRQIEHVRDELELAAKIGQTAPDVRRSSRDEADARPRVGP
jgi:hypothetical protein